MKFGLHNFPIFTTSVILFFLVRLAFTVTSTGVCHRPTNNSNLDCSCLQPLWEVSGPNQRLGSGLMSKNDLYQSIVVHPWWRSLAHIFGLKVIRVAESQLGCICQLHWLQEEGEPWGKHSCWAAVNNFITHHLPLLCRLVHFHLF